MHMGRGQVSRSSHVKYGMVCLCTCTYVVQLFSGVFALVGQLCTESGPSGGMGVW